MKTNLKIFVNATLIFAVIGFFTYLFIIVAGFLGCCVGINDVLFDQIVLTVVAVAVVTIAACMYNNCYLNAEK